MTSSLGECDGIDGSTIHHDAPGLHLLRGSLVRMPIESTPIPDLVLFRPRVFTDDRGHFFESFNEQTWKEIGITRPFVQDNESYSRRGVLRGLHYQLEPWAQSKLVRVVLGEVLDVAVDLRRGSPTFGETFSVVLSGDNRRQMYIPRGFAHAFVVLSETALFSYKCDNFYNKEAEGGIRWNDSDLAIDWRIPPENIIVSEKDALLPAFAECENNFDYSA